MTFKRKILPVFTLLILAVGGTQLFQFYRQPLGPSLELPPRTLTRPKPTLTTFPIETNTADATSTLMQATPTATATRQPMCGGPAVMNILAIGSDTRSDHYLYGLADIMRL